MGIHSLPTVKCFMAYRSEKIGLDMSIVHEPVFWILSMAVVQSFGS